MDAGQVFVLRKREMQLQTTEQIRYNKENSPSVCMSVCACVCKPVIFSLSVVMYISTKSECDSKTKQLF